MAGNGPRDWSPGGGLTPWPLRTVKVGGRRRRGFARGIALATLVVPAAVALAVLSGMIGSPVPLVSWVAAVGAVLLYRAGSGGVVSRRSVPWLVLVTLVAVLGAVTAAAATTALRANLSWSAALDPSLWVRDLVFGLILAGVGVGPTVWSVYARRTLGATSTVVVTFTGFALVFGTMQAAPVATPPVASASVWAVGDCFLESVETEGVIEESAQPRMVPCDQPHFGEVVHLGRTEGRDGSGIYPGGEWLSLEAQVQCDAPFGAFVGTPMAESALRRWVTFPTEEGWARGERELRCAVYDAAGDTTGTLRGAAR